MCPHTWKRTVETCWTKTSSVQFRVNSQHISSWGTLQKQTNKKFIFVLRLSYVRADAGLLRTCSRPHVHRVVRGNASKVFIHLPSYYCFFKPSSSDQKVFLFCFSNVVLCHFQIRHAFILKYLIESASSRFRIPPRCHFNTRHKANKWINVFSDEALTSSTGTAEFSWTQREGSRRETVAATANAFMLQRAGQI